MFLLYGPNDQCLNWFEIENVFEPQPGLDALSKILPDVPTKGTGRDCASEHNDGDIGQTAAGQTRGTSWYPIPLIR